MKRLLVFFVLATLVFTACKTIQYVPVETVREVHHTDSIYFRDTLVRIELEKARLSDFVDLGDTLVLSDNYSRSTAYLDTTSGKLKGTLETIKQYVEKNVPVKEKVTYRDSVVYQDRPYPVEVEKIKKIVPGFWRFFGILGIISLVALVLLILVKLGVFKRYV